MIGTQFAHYRIEEKLGAGGMGEVYLATDLRLDRPVALKFLPPALSSDPVARDRLLREAKAASRLNHPNILTVHAFEDSERGSVIVTEFVDGHSLRETLNQDALGFQEVLQITEDIASGLAAAHDAGIVHRDIKPENVMIDQEGRAKILDFGLAKMTGLPKLSGAHLAVGTAAYMSPEQARGRSVDARTDIWSLGAVLYEMTTGGLPFAGEYGEAVMYAIVNDEPVWSGAIPTGEFAVLDPILRRALTKDRDHRYQTIAEFLTDLRAVAQGESVVPPRAAPPTKVHASIAVLPFADMSPAQDQEYFCDGVAEQLISALTRIDGLHVVARTSAFALRGLQLDIREVGRRLGVDTVLEGSVRKVDHRVRVTAQLINVADGFHLWSDTYDRDMSDLFAIQDDLARTIVGTLRGRLLGDTETVTRAPTAHIDAYTEYLRGIYHWNKRGAEDLRRSLDHFREALRHDPAFALAWVGIADVYVVQQSWGELDFAEYLGLAGEALDRALSLDPDCAEAHSARAMMLRDARRWSEAGAAFERALALNPDYATARQWYGIYLLDVGLPDRSQEQLRRALQLDPLSLPINTCLGWQLYLTRQFDAAMQQITRTLDLDCDYPMAHEVAFWILSATDELDRAARHAPRWLAGFGATPPTADDFTNAVATGGKPGLMGLVRDVFRKHWDDGLRLVAPGLALTNAHCGAIDAAFQWLDTARDEHMLNLAEVRFAPDYDPLRTDPRLARILDDLQSAS